MKQTQNYQLNQWDKTDRIQMEDFNSDNEKTDAALQGLVQQIASEREATDAALALKGNCRVEVQTYVGTGTYGKDAPNSMTFSERPALIFLMSATEHMAFHGNSGGSFVNKGYTFTLSWSENTLSWSTTSAELQYNERGKLYTVIAFYAIS